MRHTFGTLLLHIVVESHLYGCPRTACALQSKALMLDFFGRVDLASVRNFQLESEPKVPISLLFGKLGANQYLLDVKKPLCVIQAFAAALTASVWK